MKTRSARSIQRLHERIEEARDGPKDFELWRHQTDVVLRQALGDEAPLYQEFRRVRYTPSVYAGDMRGKIAQARRDGVKSAVALLKAAQFQLEIEDDGGDPSVSSSEATMQPAEGSAGTKMFLVHGRDLARKFEVDRFLHTITKDAPVILSESPNGGKTLIEKFEYYAGDIGFAVIIATGDDVGRLADGPAGTERPRARQNVIFELGYFIGKLGRPKVALLYDENVEMPSDMNAFVHIPLDPGGGWKQGLAKELELARIPVDWNAFGKA